MTFIVALVGVGMVALLVYSLWRDSRDDHADWVPPEPWLDDVDDPRDYH